MADPTQTNISQTSIPDYAKPYVENLLGRTEALTTQTPYQSYPGERTADFTGMQNQAFTGAQNLGPASQLGTATNMAQQAGLGALNTQYGPSQYGNQYGYNPQQVSTQQFTGDQVNQYMNPYLQNALQPALQEMQRQYDITGTQQQGAATKAGAFGGSREAIMAAENQRNKNMGMNQMIGQGYNTAYQNAQQQFNTSQGQNLQANLANQQAGLTSAQTGAQYGQAANQLNEQSRQYGAGLGLQGLQTGLQAAGALGNLGGTQFNQQAQAIGVAGLYTAPSLAAGVAVADGTEYAAGAILYIKPTQTSAATAETAIKRFRPGLQVLIRATTKPVAGTWTAKVIDCVVQGTSSYLAVKTLNTYTYTTAGAINYLQVIGDVNPEGGFPVTSRALESDWLENYVQTYKESWDITSHAKLTNFRSGSKPAQLQGQALERFTEQREFSYIWGRKSRSTNPDTGKLEYTTHGIIPFIEDYASSNILDYANSSDSKYDGKPWTTAGKRFLDDSLEQLFSWTTGSVGKKLALCGPGAVSGLNRLFGTNGMQINVSSKDNSLGWSVWTFHSPFGDIDFTTYAPFALYSGYQNTMLLMEPQNMKRRTFQATSHKEVTPVGMDGEKWEYKASDGLQLLFPQTFMLLTGIGLDNA